MNIKIITIGITVVFLMILLIGCYQKNNQNISKFESELFVGTWKYNRVIGPPDLPPAATVEIVVLYENGSGNFNGKINWSLDDGKFIIVRGEKITNYDYQFSNSNTRLELTLNNETQFWRKM